jgi:hypothetical protein
MFFNLTLLIESILFYPILLIAIVNLIIKIYDYIFLLPLVYVFVSPSLDLGSTMKNKVIRFRIEFVFSS